jgi:hypothetical protein
MIIFKLINLFFIGLSCPGNTWSAVAGATSASACAHCADGTWSTAGSGTCQKPFCLYNFQNTGVNWALVRHTPPNRWHDSTFVKNVILFYYFIILLIILVIIFILLLFYYYFSLFLFLLLFYYYYKNAPKK